MSQELNAILPYIKDFGLPILGALVGFIGTLVGQYVSDKNSRKHQLNSKIETLYCEVEQLKLTFGRFVTDNLIYTNLSDNEVKLQFLERFNDYYAEGLRLANRIDSFLTLYFPELSEKYAYAESYIDAANDVSDLRSSSVPIKNFPKTEAFLTFNDTTERLLKDLIREKK